MTQHYVEWQPAAYLPEWRSRAKTRGQSHHGIRPFPKRGNLVTNERVDKLREGDAY
ncbi:MAG: hypothetical protein ACJ79O_24385 [Myxococcales bacterium]